MIIEIKVPSPGESITEVELIRWLVPDGELVRKDEEIAEVDSDKATLSITAEVSGKIKFLAEENQRIAVGSVIAHIDDSFRVENINTNSGTPDKRKDNEDYQKETRTKISPLAREIIAKNNINISKLEKFPIDKKVLKKDIVSLLHPEIPDISVDLRPEECIKISALRRKIAERLVAVKNQTAMLTTFNEIDLSEVIKIRETYKDRFHEVHGVKLSFMSFFGMAVMKALREYPAVNSRFEEEHIVIPRYIDLCIAVSTNKGLVAPAIRNAESYSFQGLEKELANLAQKARENKLTIDELTGGTFTITNGGVFGSMMSTPIINPPQSAIFGMHKIMKRPVVIDNKIEIRDMMYVALSYDHRVIDGKESVGFLVRIKEILEHPQIQLFNNACDAILA